MGLAFGLNGGGDGDAAAPEQSTLTQPAAEQATAEQATAEQAQSEAVVEPSSESASPAPPETDSADPVSSDPAADADIAPVSSEPEVDVAPVPSVVEPELTGFVIPIPGACLTQFAGHLPGAPRDYRNGTHEGLDIYGDFSCTTTDTNTPVVAAKDGVIIRIDRNYQELTLEQYTAAEAEGFQGEVILDLFRGRQIWIDHGAGIVSRYAHLGAVAGGLELGDTVTTGQLIGFVGESGTPESIFAPGTDEHIHFEIRIDESFLGAGLGPLEARPLYLEAFGIDESTP